MVPALDERSQSILLELVQDHIEKAEPVGSRSLAKSHFNKLSPATIRNVMSDLEEMGYLHQPHRSAGRIPTDQGYRFFVNHITGFSNLENLNVLPEDDERISTNQSFDEVLETACSQVSESSHQTGSLCYLVFRTLAFIIFNSPKSGYRKFLLFFIQS